MLLNKNKKLGFSDDGQEFISKFREVKDLLDTYTYSATTRQKYSTIIRMFLDFKTTCRY